MIKSLLLAALLSTTAWAGAAGQASSRFRVTDNELELPAKISFKAGTSTLDPGSGKALEHVRAYLKANPAVTLLRIEGHVAGENTQALSERRAMAVARWLRVHGISCKRLIAVGFGNTQPAFDRTPPGEASGNTRIQIKNAALRGKPVSGAPADGGGKPAGNPCQDPTTL